LTVFTQQIREKKGKIMELLEWALIAFVVAVVAAVFGFGGIARGAASVAKFLFGLFLVVAVVLLLVGLL
jgi:uncharacterized membrane protein YtjA (UPF0391 family)